MKWGVELFFLVSVSACWAKTDPVPGKRLNTTSPPTRSITTSRLRFVRAVVEQK